MVLLETPPDLLSRIAESGLVGLCLAVVMYWIVGPLLRHQMQQQQIALDLLRKAIESLQSAVESFRAFEFEERTAHEQLTRTQDEILSKLR